MKHHLTAVIHMYRGDMLLHLEKFKKAEESFSNAVQIFRSEKGLRPRQMATALRNWGVALKNQARFVEAELRLSESLKIIEKLGEGDAMSTEDETSLKDALRELHFVKQMASR